MRKLVLTTLSVFLLASLILSGCATPTPATIIQTVEVPKEVRVVETQQVVVTQEVEVTPVPPKSYPRNETLYVSGAAWGPVSTWNPYQPGSLANATGIIGNVYELLFTYDPLSAEMTPWLAEEGTWSDPNTYEVTLRSGLTWSDGEPLTAADVKFSFELGQKFAAMWYANMWRYLTGVEAVDDTHLVFTFTDPLYQEFENNLYNIPIVPSTCGKTARKRRSPSAPMKIRLARVPICTKRTPKTAMSGTAMSNGGATTF